MDRMWARSVMSQENVSKREEVLARNDCFNCGAEANYTAEGDTTIYVDCCNIDCPVFKGIAATVEQITSHVA